MERTERKQKRKLFPTFAAVDSKCAFCLCVLPKCYHKTSSASPFKLFTQKFVFFGNMCILKSIHGRFILSVRIVGAALKCYRNCRYRKHTIQSDVSIYMYIYTYLCIHISARGMCFEAENRIHCVRHHTRSYQNAPTHSHTHTHIHPHGGAHTHTPSESRVLSN